MPRNAVIEAGQTKAKISVVPIEPQSFDVAQTNVVATLQPLDGCQMGSPITGTVEIKLPPTWGDGPR